MATALTHATLTTSDLTAEAPAKTQGFSYAFAERVLNEWDLYHSYVGYFKCRAWLAYQFAGWPVIGWRLALWAQDARTDLLVIETRLREMILELWAAGHKGTARAIWRELKKESIHAA